MSRGDGPFRDDGEGADRRGPGDDDSRAPARPRLRRALRWGERVFWVAVLAFLVVRLAPQLTALTGVRLPGAHPVLGSTPAFEVTTLDGRRVTAESLRGRVVVVNFWATWCPPCRFEIPSLQSLHEDRGEEGVVVLGVSMDRGGRGEVEAFLADRGVTYPVAMADRAVAAAFGGVPGLPTTFILDARGAVRHRVFGYFAPPAMRAAVERVLSGDGGR